ncbi:unnamed protein product [Nippostrongylus brasiliensis]|uniref:C2H2-type domain-containing protein n=1 Tax=Nippostrongylus brasiliensis TaxID=27835 RepID=A0A0N4Y9S2_NIPBR|nr:unnamed protein product [Nippostrongylus brasiliensis]
MRYSLRIIVVLLAIVLAVTAIRNGRADDTSLGVIAIRKYDSVDDICDAIREMLKGKYHDFVCRPGNVEPTQLIDDIVEIAIIAAAGTFDSFDSAVKFWRVGKLFKCQACQTPKYRVRMLEQQVPALRPLFRQIRVIGLQEEGAIQRPRALQHQITTDLCESRGLLGDEKSQLVAVQYRCDNPEGHMLPMIKRERFYSPRPMPNRTNQRTYDCHCGEKYGSRKNIPSLSQLLEHFKTDHPKALILCVYCKSVFGKADAMTDNQWKRLKTHMYGELVYAKLAEMPEQKVSWFSFACFKRNQLCVLQVGPDSEE